METNDSKYMHRCLQLARLGEYYVAPNPMVGAVLVCRQGGNEFIVGEGWHRQYGGPHAEVNCFLDAESRRHNADWTMHDCTLYVSLEPCSHYGKTPPCANLIVEKGVKRVVVGCTDPNPKVAGRGIQILRDAGIEVTVGVLAAECRELNKRFMCLQEKHRPYITLKWAETADGYLDRVRTNGTPVVISTPLTKQLVHQQRAENMAIMVGTRTALLDNPGLRTTRWNGRNPIRIVLDRHHLLPPDAKLFSPDAETIVYSDCTDWQHILSDLASRNIHSVLVEGGATLLRYIISTGIYDEVHIEISNRKLADTPDFNGVKAPDINIHSVPKMIDNHIICVEKFA